jgi:hypothetical protein
MNEYRTTFGSRTPDTPPIIPEGGYNEFAGLTPRGNSVLEKAQGQLSNVRDEAQGRQQRAFEQAKADQAYGQYLKQQMGWGRQRSELIKILTARGLSGNALYAELERQLPTDQKVLDLSGYKSSADLITEYEGGTLPYSPSGPGFYTQASFNQMHGYGPPSPPQYREPYNPYATSTAPFDPAEMQNYFQSQMPWLYPPPPPGPSPSGRPLSRPWVPPTPRVNPTPRPVVRARPQKQPMWQPVPNAASGSNGSNMNYNPNTVGQTERQTASY